MKASNSRQDFTVPSLLRGKEATRIRLHTRQARGYQPKCLVLTRRYSAVAVKIPKIPRALPRANPPKRRLLAVKADSSANISAKTDSLPSAGREGGGGRGCVDVSMGGSDV